MHHTTACKRKQLPFVGGSEQHIRMNYGVAGFVRNDHFVIAKKVDPRGAQFADGYTVYEEAKAVAERLAADTAYQDVILIAEQGHEALVRVFKGVQWFHEDSLRAHYGSEWRIIDGEPPQEATRVTEAISDVNEATGNVTA